MAARYVDRFVNKIELLIKTLEKGERSSPQALMLHT